MRIPTVSFRRNSKLFWAASALLTTATVVCRAEDPNTPQKPQAKPYTRLGVGPNYGAMDKWRPAAEFRLKQRQQDLKEIEAQHTRLKEVVTLEESRQLYGNVRQALTHSHFLWFTVNRLGTEYNRFRSDYNTAYNLRFEKNGLEQSLETITLLRSGEQVVSQQALDDAKTVKDQAQQMQKDALEAWNKAAQAIHYRKQLIYEHARPTNSEEKKAYVQEQKNYNTACNAYRNALQVATLQNKRHSFLSVLMDTPEAERPKQIQTLEASVKDEIQQKEILLTQKAFIFEDRYSNTMAQYFALYDKLGMIWQKITTENRILLTSEDLPLFKAMASDYLEAHESHPAFVAKTVEALKENPLTDLRIKTEEAVQPWPENIMVASASDQEDVALGDLYFKQLMDVLPTANTLSQAVQDVAKTSLQYSRFNNKRFENAWQNPQTSTRIVSTWDVRDTALKRKVLIIAGADLKGAGEKMSDWADSIKSRLMKTYALQGDAVTILPGPTDAEIAEAFETLKSQGEGDSEVLVILAGHGNGGSFDKGLKPEHLYLQGSAQGSFATKIDENNITQGYLTENFLKTQTQKLSGYKSGMVLVLSCHSGAWIAQASEVPKVIPIG